MPFNQNVGPSVLTGGDIERIGTDLFVKTNKVTYDKIQQVSGPNKLLGSSGSYGSQDVQEISLGSGLSMNNGVLSVSGGGVSINKIMAHIAAY